MSGATTVATNGAPRRAVVIGASTAGMCAARVLADRFDRVVVLDRDRLPTAPEARGQVPQGRHPHLLLVAGARDDAVTLRFNEVAALVRPPGSMLTPTFILRVLRASRRNRRAAAGANTAPPGLSRPQTSRR